MILHSWDAERPLPELHGCFATVGNFDGVHLGHAALLHELVEWARASSRPDRPTVAITFREHPRHVLGDARPQTLIPFDVRLELLAGTGLGHTVVIPFTREFSLLSAEDFVEKILRLGLGAEGVLLGYDSFFGHNRRGNLAFLKELAPRYGLEVRGQDPLLVDHAPISSSRIRHAIAEGDLRSAERLLGRRLTITGLVIHGDARGRELGFPTANLRVQQDVVPPAGVYISAVELDGRRHPALTNIGTRPTFSGNSPAARVTIETWIDDFSGDLYGQRLTVQILEHVRKEQRFYGVEELIAQIEQDRAALGTYVRSGF